MLGRSANLHAVLLSLAACRSLFFVARGWSSSLAALCSGVRIGPGWCSCCWRCNALLVLLVLLLLLLLEQRVVSVHRVEDDSPGASLVRELVHELVACVSRVCVHVNEVHVVVAVLLSGTLQLLAHEGDLFAI